MGKMSINVPEYKKYKCPYCKKDISGVHVISECWQVGFLNGNTIVDYSGVEEVEKTISIHCSKCQMNITRYIKEGK